MGLANARARNGAVFSIFALMAMPALADVSITAVPPAPLRSGAAAKASDAAAKAAPAGLLLPSSAAAVRIALPAPTPAERALLATRNAPKAAQRGKTTTLKGPLAVAFPRAIAPASGAIALAGLQWQTLADGGRAAKVDVASPEAAALRVALQLPAAYEGVTLRFTGNGAQARPLGPVASRVVAADTARSGRYWSPVLDGDVATIEIHVERGSRVPDGTLTLVAVSHQVVAPSSLNKLDAKAVQDIGTSASCNIDVACVTPRTPAFVDATKAVAAIEFTQEDGFTYLCTGTLLNDSVSSNQPYMFSAAHCLDSPVAARTLNSFWFFDAIECGSKAVPAYVQTVDGATMLARSPDWDWALVRLAGSPPPGSRFSAWRAETIPSNVAASVIHHPQGDLKKFSAGVTQGYELYNDGSSFAQVLYNQGTTEPGSSGAGLLTFLDSAGYYELRGGLWRGEASCTTPAGLDEYSRLDNMLPLTREYLTPNIPGPSGMKVAVEFYNRALDHYFITIAQPEIDDLDSGVHGGWERTGLRFMAYDAPHAGAQPVCRYYRTPGFGNSHFYSASAAECAAVTANPQLYPGWTYESPNVFYMALPNPTTGDCGAGTQPVWRFYNQRTINHRYTTEYAVRDDMRADPSTWTPEGYGRDSVIMCAPAGS
jgi:hypothetical protein